MGELTQHGFEISGTTALRPDNVEEGQPYFNESLGVWQVRNKAGTPAWQGPYIATKWSMAALGLWGIDVDGARTNGGGIVGDVVVTEQAASLAKAFDADESSGTWGNIEDTAVRADYTSGFQLFPDSPAATDAAAFGGAVPFPELAFDGTGTPAVYDEATVIVWEYTTAVDTWSTLTIVTDQTDTDDQSGGRPFQDATGGAISFIPPSDWASVALDGQTAYWIRAIIQTGKGDNMTTSPVLNNVQHDLVKPSDGFTCPHGGTITGIRVSDAKAGTLHTAIKFILMNFTTGDHSGEKTWASGQRQDAFTGLTLAVNTGDELGVLNTDEDGTNEPTNVLLELNVSAP